jgi:PilZ domain.
MAEIRAFREPPHKREQELDASRPPHHAHPSSALCAYNRNSQRFISNNVDVPPATTASCESLLSALAPGSANAIWIVPVRTLSATGFKIPVDLLYLDEDCVVLETVQSFPLARVSMLIARASSILALPAQTIHSTGTEAGDVLMISNPDVMQRHLLDSTASKWEDKQRLQLVHPHESADSLGEAASQEEAAAGQAERRVLAESPLEIPAVALPNELVAPLETPARETEASCQVSAQIPEHRRLAQRNWWQKLLMGEPEDERKSPREALPGLVAYFFMGGRPLAQQVGNISRSGLYVLTSERWYKGTVVRMTLTNERECSVEKSITLHARVVRFTDDGVGLQFLFPSKRKNLRGSPAEAHLDSLEGATVEQLEYFISTFRSGT